MDKIIEEYYNDLKPLIKKIRNYKCINCGGNFTNSKCNYCDQNDKELEQIINKISLILNNISYQLQILNLNNIKINKLFNLLYTLNDSQDCINKFLNKYNYKQLFNEFSKEIIKKVQDHNTIFTNLEINVIETIIYQKNNQYNLKYIYHYFINRCFNNKQNVSIDCFKEIIKQLAETTLSPFYKNSTCILENNKAIKINNKNCIQLGSNKAYKIYLNEEEIENLYNNRNPEILITLFHEAIHGIQHKNIFYGNQEIDPLVILEIKDFILSKIIKNYYNDNYDNLSFEIEADYLGYQLTNQYINTKLNDRKISYKFTNILTNKNRIINGQLKDIDTIFNEIIINHPELLKKHPQLNYLYKIENNKVIPLNEEELYCKYQELIQNPNITEEQRKKYELVYSEYIDINKRLQNYK